MRPRREPATNNRQTYMVTSETWGRRALFRSPRWAELFIQTVLQYRGSAYLLHEFVVMPDHFHALITPSGSLERAVQFIKGGFSHRAKVELGSNMEVWQTGFSDHRIRDGEDYARHVEYIHRNSVRKHLCGVPAEYAYSSAGGQVVLDEVPQRLKPDSEGAGYGAPEGAPLQRKPIGASEGATLQKTAGGRKA